MKMKTVNGDIYVGMTARDGSVNAVAVPGDTYVGRIHSAGCLNIFIDTDDSELFGMNHPSGAMRVAIGNSTSGAMSTTGLVAPDDPFPVQTNYLATEDFENTGTWTADELTVSSGNVLTESTNNVDHQIFNVSGTTRTAEALPMRFFMDVSEHTRDYLRVQIYGDQIFSNTNGYLEAVFSLNEGTASVFNATDGISVPFTNASAEVETLLSGNKRCIIDFTSSAAGEGYTVLIGMGTGPVSPDDFTYTGTGATVTIPSVWLYDTSEISSTLASIVLQNTDGSHEGLAYGVPIGYDWYEGWYKPNEAPPAGFTSVVGWGTVYPKDGDEGTYTGAGNIEIKNMRTYVRLTATQTWLEVQDQNEGFSIGGGDFPADLVGDAFSIEITETGDVASTPLPALDRTIHWWLNGRGVYDANAVDAVYVQGEFRITEDEPVVMLVAADWWESASAPFEPDFSNNPTAGSGNWVVLDTSFKKIGFYSLVSNSEFTDNPAPGID